MTNALHQLPKVWSKSVNKSLAKPTQSIGAGMTIVVGDQEFEAVWEQSRSFQMFLFGV